MIPKNVQNLIDEFSRLPGIGPKSAERLTFYLLRGAKGNVDGLGGAVLSLKNNIGHCRHCWNLTEVEESESDIPSRNLGTCKICDNGSRDKSIICVVEEPLDVVALEKTGGFKGLYHVLNGVISPIDGIGPDELFISQLVERVNNADNNISEIILAVNPSLEGETTAMYIHKLLKPLDIKITRIARGLPVGGDIGYADEVTLYRALEGRREY